MDHNDQRDFAEEASNAADMEREGMEELQDEALDATRPKNARTIAETHVSNAHIDTCNLPRKSFTAMSPGGIVEILLRMEDVQQPYPMLLNHRDFWNFLIALRHLHDDPATAEDLREWAASFISRIGETYNVEMV